MIKVQFKHELVDRLIIDVEASTNNKISLVWYDFTHKTILTLKAANTNKVIIHHGNNCKVEIIGSYIFLEYKSHMLYLMFTRNCLERKIVRNRKSYEILKSIAKDTDNLFSIEDDREVKSNNLWSKFKSLFNER